MNQDTQTLGSFFIWRAQKDSNPHTRFRRPMLYPLNYGRVSINIIVNRLGFVKYLQGAFEMSHLKYIIQCKNVKVRHKIFTKKIQKNY